jgi:hypothetical protein
MQGIKEERRAIKDNNKDNNKDSNLRSDAR